MSAVGKLLLEIRRRRVAPVALVYLAVAWVLIQVADVTFPRLGLPDWSVTLVIVLAAAGFPLALVLSWIFDLSPAGVQKTDSVPPPAASAHHTLVVSKAPERNAVAVLPFSDLARDPQSEIFADGLTEDVLARIARVSGLRVISRTTVMTYRGDHRAIGEIAAELGVAAVVTGSVRRDGGRVRINVELIDAQQDRQLWAEVYDREATDVFAIQSDIAERVAGALDRSLNAEERSRLRQAPTSNFDAYLLYLRARHHWGKRPRETQKALEYLLETVRLDPDFALAHAAIADAYNTLGSWEASAMPAWEAFAAAQTAATRATELDPHLGEALTSLGYASAHYLWQWDDAKRQFERALALNPSYSHAHHWYSHYLLATGRAAEALEHSRAALRLDPLDAIINVHFAWHYWLAREPELALEHCARTAELDPHDVWPPIFAGLAHTLAGRQEAAITAHREALARMTDSPVTLGMLACTYATAGERSAARQLLVQLEKVAAQRHVAAYEIGLVHSALGDLDQGFMWLERAVTARSSWMPYCRVDPRLDPLRPDPRFQQIQRKVFPTQPITAQIGASA